MIVEALLAAAVAALGATPAADSRSEPDADAGRPHLLRRACDALRTRRAAARIRCGRRRARTARNEFFDRSGKPTLLLANSDVDWHSSTNRVQWQTRMRFGQPAAIVSSNQLGPMRVTVHVDKPELGTQRLVVDPKTWIAPRVAATALGAHSARVGWFPQTRGTTRVERIDGAGKRTVLATLAGPSSSYADTTVRPANTIGTP